MSQERWRKNDKVKNLGLWRQVWPLMGEFRHCSFAWVRGHSSHYWNCYADWLADRGRKRAMEIKARTGEA